MTDKTDNVRAAAFVVGAVVFWALGDTTVKLLSERMSIPQIMFLRGLISIVLVVVVARAGGWRPSLATLANPVVLFRGLIELVVVFAYLFGVANLPIAIANTLVFTSPLWGVALGGLVLRERLGRARIGAVLLGFAGMLFVTDPFGAKASWWALLPLAAALLQAVGDLITRRLDPAIPTDSITVTTLVMIALGGGVASLHALTLPSLLDWGFLAFGAIMLVGAYFCYIRAFRIGEMSFAAPFKYVSIPQTMLIGWLIWGDHPTWWMLFGASLIIMAGILIVWQDQPRENQQAGVSAP